MGRVMIQSSSVIGAVDLSTALSVQHFLARNGRGFPIADDDSDYASRLALQTPEPTTLARSTTRNRMNRPDRGIHSHNHQNSQQLQHQLGLDLCQLFCKQSDDRTLRCLTLYAMHSSVLVLVLPVHYTVHYAVHCTVRRTYSTVPLYL